MSASFPVAGPIDSVLAESSEYLVRSLHEFRVRLKAFMTPGKGKAAAVPVKPTHATIWVAKSCPAWQTAILKTLRGYVVDGKITADNKQILEDVRSNEEVVKFIKKAMSFVQAVRLKFDVDGAKALQSELSFDEAATLLANQEYLKSTLELEEFDVRWSSESTDAKLIDELCPGEPRIMFSKRDAL